mgnify:CR=1 FL=1
MSEEAKIEVTIRYKDLEKKVLGNADQVMRETFNFLSELLPQLQFISRISLTVDMQEFLSACEGVFAVTPEGVVVVVPTDSLTDRDLIVLHLAKAKVGYVAGKEARETLLIGDLIAATKRSAGTVAGRLSEMCSEGLVDRIGKGEYKATTYGLDYFMKNIIPSIKLKTKVTQ